MIIKEILTPKNTEEIKPNLFLQTRESGEKKDYRIINPLVWNDEFRIKEQLKTIFNLRTLIWLVIILFLVWSYYEDKEGYRKFYEEFISDPIQHCEEILQGANIITEVEYESWNSIQGDT